MSAFIHEHVSVCCLLCAGINRKAQLKWEKSADGVKSVLVVMKWGGVLTHAGAQQAEDLGKWFRSTMYPGESTGLLRLHSSFRHDLKIYSSDEGRVQMTAAAFAKGLLDLDGKLTPILASLVRSFNTNDMLDDTRPAGDMMHVLKQQLKSAVLSGGIDASLADGASVDKVTSVFSPVRSPSVRSAVAVSTVGHTVSFRAWNVVIDKKHRYGSRRGVFVTLSARPAGSVSFFM